MNIDFFVTASFFSVLGYGLCYITMAVKKEIPDKEKLQTTIGRHTREQ